LALAELADVGRRIKAMKRLVNTGVHDRNAHLDVHRMVVALLVLTYDLLSLTLPPLQAPTEPYAEGIDEIARDLIAKHPKRVD
jgi:hypothetical protein